MMKFSISSSLTSKFGMALVAALMSFGASAATPAQSEQAPRLYKYSDQGSDDGWPSMVFESKGKTYFKITKGAKAPQIVAITNCHTQVPVQSKLIDGYLMVPEMHVNYLLTIGDKQRVSYFGGANKFTAAEAPQDFLECPGKQAKGDPLSATATKNTSDATSAKTMSMAQPQKPAPRKETYVVRAADVTLFSTVSRWSKEAGWQLAWEAGKDFPARFDATYEGDYESAVEQLMRNLEHSEYPLRACAYDNRLMRIVHKSRSCRQ